MVIISEAKLELDSTSLINGRVGKGPEGVEWEGLSDVGQVFLQAALIGRGETPARPFDVLARVIIVGRLPLFRELIGFNAVFVVSKDLILTVAIYVENLDLPGIQFAHAIRHLDFVLSFQGPAI